MTKKQTTRTDNSTSEQFSKSVKHRDGWANIYTREGMVDRDKQTGYSHRRGPIMREQELKDIYRTDGFGKKIVNRVTKDMVREWFDITNDTDGEINKVLLNIGAPTEILIALRWAKIYGGSLVVMGINDGATGNDALEQPVNENNIQSIDFLKTYNRFRVTWETNDLFNDPTQSNFNTPEFYTISPLTSGAQTPFKVHASRVLRFDGELTDDETRTDNEGWDDSIFTGIRTQLINVNSMFQSVKSIVDEYVITIIKIKNLQAMIAAGQDGLIKDRLNILDLGRQTINSMMLDAEEEYERQSASVAGLRELVIESETALAAVSDYPMVILMGVSPSGMDATGDADVRLYYDNVVADQNDKMRKQCITLVRYIQLSKEGPFNGKELPDWNIEFNLLWQPTDKELAETRKIVAETDEKYIDLGVVNSQEVRESRYGGDDYSLETKTESKFDNELAMLPGPGNPKNPTFNEEPTDKKQINTDRHNVFDSFGITSEDKEHSHQIFFYDRTKGNGFTGPGGESDHQHRIEGFNVQMRNDLDGTQHTHRISNEIIQKVKDAN